VDILREVVILQGTIQHIILLTIHLPVTQDRRPEAVVHHIVADHPHPGEEAAVVAEAAQEAQVVEVDVDKQNVDK
jgi:hypothetical protein